MVRPCEAPGAVGAGEGPGPGVSPRVSGELVRPDKCLAAALDPALVRSLSRVDSLVGLEVGALLVSLVTVLVVTHVTLLHSLLCRDA